MIPVDDLIALVRSYNPHTNEDVLRRAYDYGLRMHEGQFRHSGEPYFSHPVSVAAILTEQRLDDATLVTALLHDTIEDTDASYAEVSKLFSGEVADLVDGVTKLTNIQLTSTETKQAENFRKLFMAMSKDFRVILVKLADRLHNMRTIKSMRPEKQAQKARETMDIYAPLAGRMGMQWMREELEDLAFKVLNPEGRASIIRRFIRLQKETGDVIHQITGDMRIELRKRASRPMSLGARKSRSRSGAKCRKKTKGLAACLTSMAFELSVRPRLSAIKFWASSTVAGALFPDVSKTTSASPNLTVIAACTPLFLDVMVSALRCKFAPTKCTMWPKMAWPLTGLTATVCAQITPSPLTRQNGLRV